MQQLRTQVLKESISEVLETMFFVCPVPMSGARSAGELIAEDSLAAQVALMGEGEGRVRIQCSRALAQRLAVHFTGKEPDVVVTEEVADALLEITLMVGGGILNRMDPRGAVRLSIPQMLDGTALQNKTWTIAVDVEGHTLLAELMWQFPGVEQIAKKRL